MAKLKLLKMPKVPKLPRKPKATASLSTKQAYVRRVADLKKSYAVKCAAVAKANATRTKENKLSEKLSTVIAGITSITKTVPSGFKTYTRRKKRTSAVGGVKRKTAKKKAAPKKKAAKRRRY